MTVQHIANEFVLNFGYMTPPALLRPPTQEELASIDHIPIKTIVRLGMTPDRMLELIMMLQESYREYQAEIASRQGLDD